MTTAHQIEADDAATSTAGTTIDRYLRRQEVEAEVGLRKSAIYQRIADGTFPAGDRIDGYSRRWRASEIARWKADNIQQITD